ncbi:MAG: stress responsive protein [Chloroflexi bacterium UTCFX4]|jgi:hypothetical protein|nr:MAG: stress responsive protein [Chloroflexi bacterium UTCFX4]
MLTHIVFFKLHDRSRENAEKLRDALETLRGQIAQIRAMEIGINVVASERAYDVALTQRFDSLAAMQEYQAHPAHQAVLPFLRAASASIVSVDYTN